MVNLVEAGGGVVRDLGQLDLLAREPGDHPADDHHQSEGSGVGIDPGRGQRVELLGRVTNRLLAGEQRGREHLGQERVLLGGGGVGIEAPAEPGCRP